MPNLLGMVFGMGSRDVGMRAGIDAANKGLDDLGKMLDGIDDKAGDKGAGGAFKGLMKGMRAMRYNVANMSQNVRGLTGDTGNLTNSLEAMGVANAQAVAPIVAGMNVTGKEARKLVGRISGMAIGLNTSAEGVAEVFKAIEGAGAPAKKAIDAMAMSEKDWVKVTQTTQVTMQDYAGLLGDMVASWGASPKEAAKMLNNLVEIGKKANIGTAGLKSAKAQLDAIDAIFEKLPPSMARSSEEISTLMESTYKLAGAFREFSETEEQAVQLGQQTANMFAEQAVALERAQLGIGSYEDSPLFQWLSSAGIHYEEAVGIIELGSRDAVQGVMAIQQHFQRLGGKDSPMVQAMLSKLNETMGQSAAGLGWLVSNAETGSAALKKMANMTVEGTNQLQKYGQAAYRSGRTLQESLDLAKQAFETRLRSIARKDVKKFVKYQREVYKEVGDDLKELGGDETWGPLIKSLSLFDQMGVRGLFLGAADAAGGKGAAKSVTRLGTVLDIATGYAAKLGNEFGPLMDILGQFGPLGLAAGGIAVFFMMGPEERAAIWKTIKPLWDEFLLPAWDKFKDWGQKKFGEFVSWAKSQAPVLGAAIWDGLKWAFNQLISNLSTGQLAIGGAIVAGLKLGGAFGPAGAFVGLIAGGLSAAILKVFDDAEKRLEKLEERGSELVKLRGQMGRTKRKTLDIEMGGLRDIFGPEGRKVADIGQLVQEGVIDPKDYTRQYTNFANMFASQGIKDEKLRNKVNQAVARIAKKRAIEEGRDVTPEGEAIARQKVIGFFEKMQQLPQVQRDILQAFEGSGKEIGDTVDVMMSGYASINTEQVSFMEKQADNIRLQVEAWQMGTTELLAAGGEFYEGGYSFMQDMGEGMAAGGEEAMVQEQDVLQGLKDNVTGGAHSPKEGPLAPAVMRDSGYEMMMDVAGGIQDAQAEFTQVFSQVLEDSVTTAFSVYQEKVKELSAKKSMLLDVAKSIIRDFGGEMQLGTIEVDGQKESVKKTMEAMLSIPGLAGVTAAIISESAKQRVLLSKINDNTKKIEENTKSLAGEGSPRQPVLA